VVAVVGDPPRRSVTDKEVGKKKRLRNPASLLGYCVQSSSNTITMHVLSGCSRIALGLHIIANRFLVVFDWQCVCILLLFEHQTSDLGVGNKEPRTLQGFRIFDRPNVAKILQFSEFFHLYASLLSCLICRLINRTQSFSSSPQIPVLSSSMHLPSVGEGTTPQY
jgi:hypothetical protein